MTKDTIAGFLIDHASSDSVSFHMPGHKGSLLYRENGYEDFLKRLIDCDITEIPGADNLFQTEGIIKATMERYRKLYGAKASYLLINGSSCGLISAIMTCVPLGGKIIIARNCHKSVFNGVSMAGAEPVYAYPEIIEGFGITGEITAKEIQRCLDEAPDASAVLLPSPNYYGVCSDIEKIAEAVHQCGKVLIVDQAHGAHLKFFDQYIGIPAQAAENQGADIVIDSTHKTLASFTQTAVANVCSDRIDKYAFEDALQKMESTSPSYLMMASLDINADILEKHGKKLITRWREDLDYFYQEAYSVKDLVVMSHPMMDDSKINLDMSAYGLDGFALEQELMKRGIFPELNTGNIVMCMTGIGNRRYDYERLIEALEGIASTRESVGVDEAKAAEMPSWNLEQRQIPTKTERLPIGDAIGRTCAQSVIPYPPGIPAICPGEVFNDEVVNYVAGLRKEGENVMGIDDKGRVVVGK